MNQWAIVPMFDHYAVMRDGALMGIIERFPAPQNNLWGFYPVNVGTQPSPVQLHDAIQNAVRYVDPAAYQAANPERTIQ